MGRTVLLSDEQLIIAIKRHSTAPRRLKTMPAGYNEALQVLNTRQHNRNEFVNIPDADVMRQIKKQTV